MATQTHWMEANPNDRGRAPCTVVPTHRRGKHCPPHLRSPAGDQTHLLRSRRIGQPNERQPRGSNTNCSRMLHPAFRFTTTSQPVAAPSKGKPSNPSEVLPSDRRHRDGGATRAIREDRTCAMARRGKPDWEALLRWSSKYADGTSSAKEWSETDREWLESAFQQNMVDEVQRMKEIAYVLELEDPPEGYTEEQFVDAKAELLEEMQDLVESLDNAKDLKGVGGFDVLMKLMQCNQEKLRCRAAEVIATSVQNNPQAQEWALQGGALQQVLQLLEDPVAICRTKGMLAVSCLVRGYKPAREAFRHNKGYEKLLKLLEVSQGDIRTQRKIARFLAAIVMDEPSEAREISALGLPEKFEWFLDHEDGEMREAALGMLLAVYNTDTKALHQAKESTLPAVLEVREKAIRALDKEDEETVLDEHAMIKQLQTLLLNEAP